MKGENTNPTDFYKKEYCEEFYAYEMEETFENECDSTLRGRKENHIS